MTSHLFITESLQVESILIFFPLSFESTVKSDSILLQYMSFVKCQQTWILYVK